MAGREREDAVDLFAIWYRRIIVTAFILIVLRLFWMQVLKYPDFLSRAASNKVKRVQIIAPRGQIFDRAGRSLAINEPVFSLMYFPPLAEEKDETIPVIAYRLGVTDEIIRTRIEAERKRRFPYQPIALYDNLTLEQVVYFSEHKTEFPGIFVEENNYRRKYIAGPQAAHIIGYTGLISEDDPSHMVDFGYERDEFVGKTGIEKAYETILHGRAGSREIEITKDRFFRREVRYNPPISGTDIYLTIDLEIQNIAYNALKGRRGCVIVSAPKTGEIIAMVSSPSFDPNRLHGRENADYVNSLISDQGGLPLFFRPIAGKYPPGSTFKLVTAVAGLESGKLSENMQWTCKGSLDIGNRTFREHFTPSGHGPIVFRDAIAKSCDVTFWDAGVKIGSRQISKYARLLGFGDKLGIDLPGEAAGRIPNREYKLKNWKEEWWDGDTANMSIGQGFVTATPLEVLWSVNAIVCDGIVSPPHVLKAEMIEGKVKEALLPRQIDTKISPNTMRIIREGMRRAVIYGTCKQMKESGVTAAGKTGTADVAHGQMPHGWFVGFFPYNEPQYSIVVLLENAGKSSDSAVPIATEIVRQIGQSKGLVRS